MRLLLVIATAYLLGMSSSSATALFIDAHHQPVKWQIRGFKAAIKDRNRDVLYAALRNGTSPFFALLDAETKRLVAPLLLQSISHDHDDIRDAAAAALGMLGDGATPQIEGLAELLTDEHWEVRESAAKALGAIGSHATGQSLVLAKRLRDERSEVRKAAAEALGALGKHAARHAGMLVKGLTDKDYAVRLAAERALGMLGQDAKSQVPSILELLKDEDTYVRSSAARALGELGEHAGDQASELAKLLNDRQWAVREAAAKAMGRLGVRAGPYAPVLAGLMSDKRPDVRKAAIEALASLEARDTAHLVAFERRLSDEHWAVRQAAVNTLGRFAADLDARTTTLIVSLLEDGDAFVRAAAAKALGSIGKRDVDLMAGLVELTTNTRWEVRQAAVETLGTLGSTVKHERKAIIDRLGDDHWIVREAAAKALGGLSQQSSVEIPSIEKLLRDDRWQVRHAALQMLINVAKPSPQHAALIATMLDDDRWDIRETAALALGRLGPHASSLMGRLAEALADDRRDVRLAAGQALFKLGPIDMSLLPAIFASTSAGSVQMGEARLLGHLLGGGHHRIETLLDWLPNGTAQALELAKRDHHWARTSLRLFNTFWQHTEKYPGVRRDLAQQSARLVTGVQWQSTDLPLLELSHDHLRQAGSTHAAAIRHEILQLEATKWSVLGVLVILSHGVFWSMLIFAYPRYPQIQALFFWNKWVRRIAGFGYVGLLLAWVPFLRRRLFKPFEQVLLADARLADFKEADYFTDSVVRGPGGELRSTISSLATIDGQIIIEGSSGLGKSMFLRYLLKNQRRLVIFLRACDCGEGVLQAMQSKLEGPAKDSGYLQKLVYAGAIDIVIDGLNEVSASTRSCIVEFAKRSFRCNLLVATQPMEWDPPPLAKVFIMQPLQVEQIEAFLIGRYCMANAETSMSQETYMARCRDFLRGLKSEQLASINRNVMQGILSNPMDLSIIAQILMRNQLPNLFDLQQQQFDLMAEDYRRRHADNPFPLKIFAERVYEMRVNDVPAFKSGEFANELAVMARFKMVVPYHHLSAERENEPRWTFRHDKILDFFLVEAFRGSNNSRPESHLGDSRFRGTYLMLAHLLPLDAAENLERQLVNYAADSKDHTVSDEFVQRLRPRRAA